MATTASQAEVPVVTDDRPRYGPGFVYLFERKGLHKIGLSVDPHDRVTDMGVYRGRAVVVATIRTAAMMWLERYLHRAYRGKRVRGEWFDLTPHDVALISGIASADAESDLPQEVRDLHAANLEDLTHTQVKVDDQLTDRIRSAAAKLSLKSTEAGGERVTVQEYVSDLLNRDTARILGLKPITRRPPPAPPKGKGRPRKS